MLIYHYDEHGALVEAAQARLDPEEAHIGFKKLTRQGLPPTLENLRDIGHERYLVPRNATQTEPPAAAPGEVQIYDPQTDTWSVTEDHRGKTAYKTDEPGADTLVTQPGPLPPELTLDARPRGARWDGAQWVVPPPPDPDVARFAELREELLNDRAAGVSPDSAKVDEFKQLRQSLGRR